jgi:protoporphyrinogen oxidase
MAPLKPWIKSKAKALLKEEIITKTVTADSHPKGVHESHPQYKKYPFRNFKSNMKNLIKACQNPKKKTPTKWKYNEAKKLLIKDIMEGHGPKNCY